MVHSFKQDIELIRRYIKELELKIGSVKKDIVVKLVSILGSLIVSCFGVFSVLVVFFKGEKQSYGFWRGVNLSFGRCNSKN